MNQPDIHQKLTIDGDADVVRAVTAALEAAGLTVYPVPSVRGESPQLALDPAHISMALAIVEDLDLPARAADGQAEQPADAAPKRAAPPPARGSAAGAKAEQS